ncbi:hypothetical protein [Gordonia alkanivorans]|uniref:hypothetical protein n=1 Tax=Gordonia alkanivorans TaxID=84096 RepID=UPI0005A86C3A|nr:hypothetical protein [Gordonia alkanivorans]
MLDTSTITDPELREEWQHFRQIGWPDDRIAARLGVSVVGATAPVASAPPNPKVPRSAYYDAVADLHARGLGTSAIARQLSVRPNMVTLCKKDLGIQVSSRPRRPQQPNLAVRQRVAELYESGMSCAAIANRLGIALSAVWRHKVAAGVGEYIPQQDRSAVAAERRARVVSAHATGLSAPQVANLLGLPLGTVKSDLRRARRIDEATARSA